MRCILVFCALPSAKKYAVNKMCRAKCIRIILCTNYFTVLNMIKIIISSCKVRIILQCHETILHWLNICWDQRNITTVCVINILVSNVNLNTHYYNALSCNEIFLSPFPHHQAYPWMIPVLVKNKDRLFGNSDHTITQTGQK